MHFWHPVHISTLQYEIGISENNLKEQFKLWIANNNKALIGI